MNQNRREFLIASMAIALSGCSDGSTVDNGAGAPAARFAGASKYVYDDVPVLVLAGSWLDMGMQYGYFLSEGIRTTHDLVAPFKDLYNRGCGKMNSDIIEEIYQAYPQHFKEFFSGVARTSGLSLDQLKVANALEMVLIFGSDSYPPTRCSAVSVWGEYSRGGHLVYGRNYDYAREFSVLDDHIAVTIFKPDSKHIPFAICTWAGCVYASTGINKKGMFVEENDCSPHDKEASGFYIAGDHYNMKTWVRDDVKLLSLLTDARSMSEADNWMRNNLPIYPHNIGIADKTEARCYQWNIPDRIPNAPYVRQANGLMAQTNHYFMAPNKWNLPVFSEGDGIDRTIPGGSVGRVNNLLALAEKLKGEIDQTKMCDIMDTRYENGGATVDSTLFQIVCEPETFSFKLKTLKRQNRWIDIPLYSLLVQS